jgi:Rrf2 family nitric oxide-sensitive transcriptional repressor
MLDTGYSLRILMYLAVRAHGFATSSEVAEVYGIAKNHPAKVARQLGMAGDIETVRGPNTAEETAGSHRSRGGGTADRTTSP